MYWEKHSTNDSQCDFCSCFFETSSSIRGLIMLRVILMSFATLRHLQLYVVLILTRADMAASQRYVVRNGINASRALFGNSGYCNILHQNSISEKELNLVFAA